MEEALQELSRLLLACEPARFSDAHVVQWDGPYFVDATGAWHPTGFVLREGRMHGWMEMPDFSPAIRWDLRTGQYSLHVGRRNPLEEIPLEPLWDRAARQILVKLRAALRDPQGYRDGVSRSIPLECRTGKIRREWSWPPGASAPLSPELHDRLREALRRGLEAADLRFLTAARYVEIVAVALTAAFPDLTGTPEEKYRARADTRHEGFLDLPRDDPDAFEGWFARALGSHAFEIAFGYPKGIMLFPIASVESCWRFRLSVDMEGYRLPALRMAVALAEADIPFEFPDADQAIAASLGEDCVRVGPRETITLEDLREVRPDAVEFVEWDPLPEIRPITEASRMLVQRSIPAEEEDR